MTTEDFLPEYSSRPFKLDGLPELEAKGLYIGEGQQALEVAVVAASSPPAAGVLLKAWKSRRAGRATPVLLVCQSGESVSVCGPSGDNPPVFEGLEEGQIRRLCEEALRQPNRHTALRFLSQALPSLETVLPGIRNEGLLALHELNIGAPSRRDWGAASNKAEKAAGKPGKDLLKALGFKVEKLDNQTELLKSGDRRTALAVLLQQDESPEASTSRFNSLSPISYALSKADSENLPWVILVQGNRIRLYPTAVGIGVGRRGRTETFVECQPALLDDSHLGLLWLLFSADALKPDGSMAELLETSTRYAGALATRLRDRIYIEVVPRLASGIALARNLERHTPEELHTTYQMALMVLFRMLFIAYAEDRDLLPYRFNDAYKRRSLKQKAIELAEAANANVEIAKGASHWQEVEKLWIAVAQGNSEWAVPAYDGGLFSSDPSVSSAGAELAKVRLDNNVFEPALRGLLLIEASEGELGPVDFRSLGVREFGTIYEGLLESQLSVADVDLALNSSGTYVPCSGDESPEVPAGAVYLHNKSGARKSSGSYYTKHFAVEHLLDRALEPALTDHLSRVDALDDDNEKAAALFDFRVADIAMGSGHFLVAAIDRIERRLSEYLAENSLSGVVSELSKLKTAAEKELGELADNTDIEDGQLLRRMIARRCIYGVDMNELSVQLARLSIWIHTFVPGLPLSLLDNNLVFGNSLVGVATVDQIRAKFEEFSSGLFPIDTRSLLGAAAQPLRRVANLSDASLEDVAEARSAFAEAQEAVESTRALCDIITAAPVAGDDIEFQYDRWEELRDSVAGSNAHKQALKELKGLDPLHFPVAFPEVFLRERSGFDVLLGNPPWQEATLEEHAFWARHFPGLRGLSQRLRKQKQEELSAERPDLSSEYESELEETARLRRILVGGGFPGMGTGDPDLYKAFCWRFWELVPSAAGRIGVVLPRSALAAKGSTLFRKAMLTESSVVDLTLLLNNKKWVFSEVHPQYTIGLVSITRGKPEKGSILLSGPFPSLRSFAKGVGKKPNRFSTEEVLAWNDSASLPLLPSSESVDAFVQLRSAPRLDLNDGASWRARPDTEMHATNQKPLMDLDSEECPEGHWPVFKGESFDIWTPDTGKYYAWADPEDVMPWLQGKRSTSATRRKDSVHAEFPASYIQDESTLAPLHFRVAFRDVTRSTDSRTVRAALLPENIFITNKGPYFLWPRGDEFDVTFLLGVLSTIPLDWYARRFVEVNLNFFILNPFPVPRPERSDMRWKRVVELAGRLSCPDKRFSSWAKAIGVSYGSLKQGEKDSMIHELDAVVSHLYGLNKKQLAHIYATFHEGWDYKDRLNSTLEYFDKWAGKTI